jgi:hypothetical protein
MNEVPILPDTTIPLGQILRVLCRSLPMYLEDARPWTAGDDEPLRTALARLVADQRRLARRVADAILRRGGQPAPGPFPLEFTGLNDVSLSYLAGQVCDRVQRDIDAVGRAVAELAADPEARDLAEEVLGNLQGHLDLLLNVPSPSGRGQGEGALQVPSPSGRGQGEGQRK